MQPSASAPATSRAQRPQLDVKVLITLTDVEPAVRLNAQLERDGVETAVVSPLDDVRGAIRREKPDVIVITGALLDPQNVALVRELLWDGVAVVGLADVRDPEIDERLRAIGFVGGVREADRASTKSPTRSAACSTAAACRSLTGLIGAVGGASAKCW